MITKEFEYKLKNAVTKLKKKALSGDDLLKALNNTPLMITYPQLVHYKSIYDILNINQPVIILYETKLNFGHWCCLYINSTLKNTISFFDSYGGKPDDQLKFIPEYFARVNNEDYPLLTLLLYKSGAKIEYNQYKLQRDGSDINTCGRHVITRLQYPTIKVNDYNKILNSYHPLSPDDIVTLLTGYI